jgi:Ca2+-binding RTX toxin-like protein
MITRSLYGLALLGLIILILVSSVNAIAASNTVPPTNLGDWRTGISANTLKPAACASLNLTNIVVGSGHIKGEKGVNNLIIGSAGNDNIDGGDGDDCILAGGGDDTINGGTGYNICIGGPGNNTYAKCDVIIP